MVLKYRPILFCFALLYSASQILHFLQVEKCVSCSVVSNSLPSMDCGPPGSSIHGILQARILEWVAISFSRGIFPTQGLTPGLLHCRQILYHLSCQGSWSMATLHQIILSESLLPTAASHFKPLCHILIILPHGLWPTRLLCPWSSPGENIGVGCCVLLQGTFQARDGTWTSHFL